MDGRSVNFWSDIWADQSTLWSCFPDLADVVQSINCRVRDCYGLRGWRWRKILAGFDPISLSEKEAVADLKVMLSSVVLSEAPDVPK